MAEVVIATNGFFMTVFVLKLLQLSFIESIFLFKTFFTTKKATDKS